MCPRRYFRKPKISSGFLGKIEAFDWCGSEVFETSSTAEGFHTNDVELCAESEDCAWECQPKIAESGRGGRNRDCEFTF